MTDSRRPASLARVKHPSPLRSSEAAQPRPQRDQLVTTSVWRAGALMTQRTRHSVPVGPQRRLSRPHLAFVEPAPRQLEDGVGRLLGKEVARAGDRLHADVR